MIALPAAVPVEPDAGTARRWLLEELAKPAYAAAQPSPFDRAAQAFLTWFTGLFDVKGSSAPPIAMKMPVADEVPTARTGATPRHTSSGTVMLPPPIPTTDDSAPMPAPAAV